MKLFISHASEDKHDFVRPLAEALAKHFDVWYDEYVLTVGDSLQKKISEGLNACDFGVVVLSKAFFTKHWPQAELDGLFSLETATRKIILPIWKDVTAEEVRKFSPILAGRMAVLASEGIPQVVTELQRAVDVSERTRQISNLQSAMQRARALDQTIIEKQQAEKLIDSEEGCNLVMQNFTELYSILEKNLGQLATETSALKFTFKKSSPNDFTVHTLYFVSLNIHLTQVYINTARDTKLQVVIYKRNPGNFGEHLEPTKLKHIEFKPTFRSTKQVVWISQGAFGTQELAGWLIDQLVFEIGNQSKTAN